MIFLRAFDLENVLILSNRKSVLCSLYCKTYKAYKIILIWKMYQTIN